jgi:KDO2-lipid IV(A) lauroyltransferase
MKLISITLNYLALGFLYFLSFLPIKVNHFIGDLLGTIASSLPIERTKVVEINLQKCFPDLSEQERTSLAKKNWRLFGRSMTERAYLWLGSKSQIKKLVNVQSEVPLNDGVPRLLVGIHLMGIEAGAIALSLYMSELGIKEPTTLYVKMKNNFFDFRIRNWRERFGAKMLNRLQSSREMIRSLKSGQPVVISPDMDLGLQDSVFVPFFGIQTCTVTSVSRIAQLAKAQVCSVTTSLNPDGQSYTCHISKPWQNFPSDDVVKDTTRLNQHFEALIRPRIEEYYWVHKRFKNRPDQQAKFY